MTNSDSVLIDIWERVQYLASQDIDNIYTDVPESYVIYLLDGQIFYFNHQFLENYINSKSDIRRSVIKSRIFTDMALKIAYLKSCGYKFAECTDKTNAFLLKIEKGDYNAIIGKGSYEIRCKDK